MSEQLAIEKITAEDIASGVGDAYRWMLFMDLQRTGIATPDAYRMAYLNKRNTNEALTSSASSPDKADIFVARGVSDGRVRALAKVGLERYGDRYDFGPIVYRLARAAHKLELVRRNTLQIFGYGADPDLSPEDEQLAFADIVQAAYESALDQGHSGVRRVSAFVDTQDKNLSRLVESINPKSLEAGSKTVSIALGGVAHDYRRLVVDFPAQR
ncbi:hypothetical protein EOM60_02190 [Candidatus Saccharibacteria bacterium]|nr:hypothetical protein [Candidatus Saccharibacteria bacterium]